MDQRGFSIRSHPGLTKPTGPDLGCTQELSLFFTFFTGTLLCEQSVENV